MDKVTPARRCRPGLLASCIGLALCGSAVATDSKSGGDWFDPGTWTDGQPSATTGGTIKGHSIFIERASAAAAALFVDGALDIKAAKPRSTTRPGPTPAD